MTDGTRRGADPRTPRHEPAWHRRQRACRQQARLLLAAVKAAGTLANHHSARQPRERPLGDGREAHEGWEDLPHVASEPRYPEQAQGSYMGDAMATEEAAA